MATEDAATRSEVKRSGKSHAKRKKDRNCLCPQWMCRNGFVLLLLLATFGGYIIGFFLQSQNLSNHTIYLIGFPGQLVMRSFFMIIVPLLFCSLVLGVASLRKGGDARMVAITIGFFLSLSTFASIMGATAGHLIKPGKITSDTNIQAQATYSGRKGVILDSMLDLLWNAIPENIVESTFVKEFTHVEIRNASNSSDGSVVYKKTIQQKKGVNFMGLLTFSILFGCALAALGDKGEVLHQVIEQLNAVILSIMKYFLKLLPIGMFFWMFREGLESSAPVQLLGYLGVFLAAAFGCIIFHQFVLLPLLYVIIVRKNPVRYHLNLLPAILTAFGTSSSAATLPATVKCAEEANRLNLCVTRFVLPLGMVVHMNGGTFYITMSTIFLAQLEGITISAAETVVVCVTTILLMISAPGTAGGGNPVYLLTAMAAVGITNPQFIYLYLSMEWLMERFRTVMNVVADSYVAAFVEKLCYNSLPLDPSNTEYLSPVIDGYNHQAIVAVDVTNTQRTTDRTSICRCCGSHIDVP